MPDIYSKEWQDAAEARIREFAAELIADMRVRPDVWRIRRPRPVTDEQWDADMARQGLWAV